MLDEEEDFEVRLQEALAAGIFSKTSGTGKKSWNPFNFRQKKVKETRAKIIDITAE